MIATARTISLPNDQSMSIGGRNWMK